MIREQLEGRQVAGVSGKWEYLLYIRFRHRFDCTRFRKRIRYGLQPYVIKVDETANRLKVAPVHELVHLCIGTLISQPFFSLIALATPTTEDEILRDDMYTKKVFREYTGYAATVNYEANVKYLH